MQIYFRPIILEEKYVDISFFNTPNKYLRLDWAQDESFSVPLEKGLIILSHNIDDLIPFYMIEKRGNLDYDTFPSDVKVYEHEDGYIISAHDLEYDEGAIESCIAIEKNTFILMQFVKEYLLPFYY